MRFMQTFVKPLALAMGIQISTVGHTGIHAWGERVSRNNYS